MGRHIQRRHFDNPELAAAHAAEFAHPRWRAPGIKLKATALKIGSENRVYVIQEGHIIDGNEPLLPDYEKV